jgi:hypothetical protein
MGSVGLARCDPWRLGRLDPQQAGGEPLRARMKTS